ncbi:hypothetical protein AsFPU1_0014 [Aphanothece sacrum FPU1]|uniref:Uncharacterized protein n=2 Tax=Aphanothece sacrum TaxID=1122 RepID=A0A401IBJ4_APHSA|nr:hypothetical protein AsFPU1_0014 [Aphanothece sacrum FPU1]GBF84864.1 hypothetical protein AsFPU3_1919 [Aphanothece sacrum FPU3]
MISSCGTDPAIQSAQSFGLMAADFENNTDKLAEDIYNSCIRKLSYFSVASSQGTTQRDNALANCQTLNKPAVGEAKNANKIVTDYGTSIGKLAVDDIVKFDDEFNNIKNALNKFSIPSANGNVTLPQGAVNTGTQIANLIFGWVVSQERKGTLREAIICTDKPLQTYTKGLENAFRDGYINGVLNDEEDRAKSYYDFYITQLRQLGTSRDFMELERESSEVLQNFVKRRNAAESYIAIINKTAQAHTKLKDVFLGDSEPPSEEYCNIYLKAKESNSTAINSVHQRNSLDTPLTLKELAQVQKIALNYRKEIEPLLQKMEQELK